ncbi:MAG: DsbE family thiol:disulfide interchange protein [Alphaproteobacteria bacterium]
MRLKFVLPIMIFLALATVLGVLLLDIQSGRHDPRALPSALIGKPAPAFALPSPAGLAGDDKPYDYTGKVTLVNVFASWCIPCVAEHPYLAELARDKTHTTLGINYKDKDADAVAWLARHGNPYARIGADRDGRFALDWGVYGVPETFVVDKAGIVRFKHVGPLTPSVIERELNPLLAKLKR